MPSILHVLVLSVPIEPWQLLCLAYLNCPHVSSMVTGYLSAILYSNKNVLMGSLGQDSNHKNQSCYNINLNFEKNTLVFICSLHANQITQKKRSLNLWYIYIKLIIYVICYIYYIYYVLYILYIYIFVISLTISRNFVSLVSLGNLEGCVLYIFASLFCISKKEHLWNKETCFLFTSKALFVLEIIKF